MEASEGVGRGTEIKAGSRSNEVLTAVPPDDITTGMEKVDDIIYYENCTCPHCQAKLDAVPEKTPLCPKCKNSLDLREVWATRKYSGIVELPPWIVAFTWPLGLMIAGVAMFLWYRSYGHVDFLVPGVLFAIGFAFFVIKLNYSK